MSEYIVCTTHGDHRVFARSSAEAVDKVMRLTLGRAVVQAIRRV